jgi:hypothetical protein
MGIFSDFKIRDEAGNGDIDTHPEPVPESAPDISNYILPLLNYKHLNKILNYIHTFIFSFKLSIKKVVFSIFFLFKKIILSK